MSESKLPVAIKSTELNRIHNSILLTNKILFNGADILFNEGFHLMYSKQLKEPSINYCFLILNDTSYLKRIKFDYLDGTKEDHLKAIELFNTAISLSHIFFLAYWARGIVKKRVSTIEDWIQDLSKCIEIEPNFLSAFLFRAKFYLEQKEYLNAIEDYSKAIVLNSTDDSVYVERGYTYTLLENYTNALNDLYSALMLNPQLSRAYIEIGKINEK